MKHLTRFATLLLVSLSPCSLAATPTNGTPTVIPLARYLDAIPSFNAMVGETGKRFLLDTAGGVSVATPALAKQIGCQPWGRVTGFRMRGDRIEGPRCDNVHLESSGIDLQLPSMMVWDFAAMLPDNAPPLAGSLALDAFKGRAITLDLAGNALIVETPESLAERIRHATEIPARFNREAQGLGLVPFAAVQTPRGNLWMELDSGSVVPLIVDRNAARALGIDTTAAGPHLHTLQLGGKVPIQAEISVQDLIIDGNIGEPVLRQWWVTLDLAQERLWIAPRAQPAEARDDTRPQSSTRQKAALR